MNADVAAAQPVVSPSRRQFGRLASFAMRELRGGLQGFYVFVACVALGVAVITAVGALTDALRAGFEQQGEILLGGDVTLSRPHRRAEPAERTWMESRGRVSETATLRAMAGGPMPANRSWSSSRASTKPIRSSGASHLATGRASMPPSARVRGSPSIRYCWSGWVSRSATACSSATPAWRSAPPLPLSPISSPIV